MGAVSENHTVPEGSPIMQIEFDGANAPETDVAREADRLLERLANSGGRGMDTRPRAVTTAIRNTLDVETYDIQRLIRPSRPDRPAVVELLAEYDAARALALEALDALDRTTPSNLDWQKTLAAARSAVSAVFGDAHASLVERIERRHGSHWTEYLHVRDLPLTHVDALEPVRKVA